MTVWLSNDMKDRILDKVRQHVTEKYDEGGTGAEYVAMGEKLASIIQESADKLFPGPAMAVLAEYDQLGTFDGTCVDHDADGTIRFPCWNHGGWYPEIGGSLAIKVPRHEGSGKLLDYLRDNYADELGELLRLFHLRKCEVDDLVSAYRSRIDQFRTVGKLLQAHPGMAGFIPAKSKPVEKPEPTDAEKKILAFEES